MQILLITVFAQGLMKQTFTQCQVAGYIQVSQLRMLSTFTVSDSSQHYSHAYVQRIKRTHTDRKYIQPQINHTQLQSYIESTHTQSSFHGPDNHSVTSLPPFEEARPELGHRFAHISREGGCTHLLNQYRASEQGLRLVVSFTIFSSSISWDSSSPSQCHPRHQASSQHQSGHRSGHLQVENNTGWLLRGFINQDRFKTHCKSIKHRRDPICLQLSSDDFNLRLQYNC